jgi:DNA-binding NarL/FixJ family response regulator
MDVIDELGESIVLVLLDHRLPDAQGIDLLQKMRTKLPTAKILMATMHDERSMMRDAFKEGCTGFLVKPHGFMELFKRIQGVTENREVLNTLDNLIFDQYGPREWRG